MQATLNNPTSDFGTKFLRNLAWFLVVPITTFVLGILLFSLFIANYQSQHENRIYTGVSAWGVDLSSMTLTEARAALESRFPYATKPAIVLYDSGTGKQWQQTPAQLGMTINLDDTINQAYLVGRGQSGIDNLRQQFETWYFGHYIAPTVIFDESKVDAFVNGVAAEVNVAPRNADLIFDGNVTDYSSSQVGRVLDAGKTRAQILAALNNLELARIALPITQINPTYPDASRAAAKIQQIIGSPITLYLNEPLSESDLTRVEVTTEELKSWLRIQTVAHTDGTYEHDIFVDENAVRNWLLQFEDDLYREPERARFYFDDGTRQLVVVEPHVNGRELDVEATLSKFMNTVEQPNRSLSFVLRDVVPEVNTAATAAGLGITELVTENTTWFRGSTLERKHNIARAAANFYGIVVAPGETFSFNQYLGNVSKEDGYETGLIIFGGRTIEGVGGGVCQVSTTLFQSAFWAGFPIEERWAHGYRVSYYDDGEGAGMDATIFSPLVDLRFTNNTPYHLLIENYYNEAYESLTFKFYSTSMNRSVVKGPVQVSNVVPPKPDIWEFNPDLPEGDIEQVDWAVAGSDVTITRQVYNADGQSLYGNEVFQSHYIPWQNIYQYGPGVTPPGGS